MFSLVTIKIASYYFSCFQTYLVCSHSKSRKSRAILTCAVSINQMIYLRAHINEKYKNVFIKRLGKRENEQELKYST